jgi:cytochrome c556
MLSARMDRHGEEMMMMLVSVMMLQHRQAELLAEHVAAEPQLGRPSPGEKGTISALLPPRFFALQDQLVSRAHAVAAAARANDSSRIVRAYGQLVETCVSCHAVYLKPDSTEFQLPGD